MQNVFIYFAAIVFLDDMPLKVYGLFTNIVQFPICVCKGTCVYLCVHKCMFVYGYLCVFANIFVFMQKLENMVVIHLIL